MQGRATHRIGGPSLLSVDKPLQSTQCGPITSFTEDLPQLTYAEIATIDAPLFVEFREFLTRSTAGIGDPELAMWMVATVANAVIHRAVVARPEDLSNGSIRDELVALLARYLNGFRQGAGHHEREGASP